MLITYINKNKKFPMKFEKQSNFVYKLINLIKNLLMNELELALFTILIDKFGWEYKNIDSWLYFSILGIYSKKVVKGEEESSFLIDIFSKKNKDLLNYYTLINDELINKKEINNSLIIKLINKRFNQLTKPINSYCKRNYINYNGVVDKIVKLSQPYEKRSNIIHEKINFSDNLVNNIEGDFQKNKFLSPLSLEQKFLNNDNNTLQPLLLNTFSDPVKININSTFEKNWNNSELNNSCI